MIGSGCEIDCFRHASTILPSIRAQNDRGADLVSAWVIVECWGADDKGFPDAECIPGFCGKTAVNIGKAISEISQHNTGDYIFYRNTHRFEGNRTGIL